MQKFFPAAVMAATLVLGPAMAGAQDREVLDENGRVIAIVHEDGSRTLISRDDAGRVVTVLNPDGSRVCYQYREGEQIAVDCS